MSPDGPVAIVGIGCRYADARGPEEIWDIIRTGRNTVRDVPQHRVELGYDIDHFYDPRPRIPGRISSKKGGFLEHPELFDPAAFGISPRDASTMDPQQRLMVEVTWDALEDAGIAPSSIVGERVAVILGYMAEDYSRERTGVLGEEAVFRGHDVFTVGGMSHAVLSGRIGFLLGVTGPSFTLDTACSSSLIATHLACQSLRRGESNMAIAGGANLFLSPEGNIALSRSGMLSMSGACKAFDAGADGFVRAEGAGVVVLKRLADAIADDDPIYAVIRGSGISTDGRDGGHMMAPGRKGQAQAMRDAYAQAGVDPSRVQYVETHGTGTMIGDPVEIGALADVMGPGRDPANPLRVASIKGHLGHTESASGVAGLIQACLAIRHRTLPKQMHFETPNPAIPWDDVPVRVQTELEPWPEPGPALVGVNSFGISGTNAHVVLESPPERRDPAETAAKRGVVLPISAHDPRALDEMATALRDRLADASADDARDVLHTLGTRREARPHRLVLSGGSVDEVRARLDAHLAGEAPAGVSAGSADPDRRPQLVMVFPGQGSQFLGMGRDLLRDEPVFADAIDRIDAAYRNHVDWSLRERLETSAAEASSSPERDWTRRLDELQPVLVAFEIALAELWRSWGVVPDRVIGQSMGEIAAAHVAGALDLAAVAHVACHRGRIVARASGQGGMALVSLPRSDVATRLARRDFHGHLEIAGVNSPSATIVAGDRDDLANWVASLESEAVFARALDVDFASHCFQMDPLLEPFRAGLDGLAARPAQIPIHSTVDGETRTGDDLDADYWVSNLRSAVALDRAVEGATAAGGEIFLELSAHPTLARALGECASAAGRSIHFVGSLTRDEPDATSLALGVGELFTAGARVDFERFGPTGRVARLPLYAYQRERYWFSERTRLDTFRSTHPLLGAPVDYAPSPDTRLWTFLLDADTAGFAADHRVAGRSVVPSATFIELALEAGRALWPDATPGLRALDLDTPLSLDEGERRVVQVVARRRTIDRCEVSFASRPSSVDHGDAWHGHGTATIHVDTEGALDANARLDVATLEGRGRTTFDEAMRAGGVEFGTRTKSLRELIASDRGVLARIQLPRSVETEWQAYGAHPAMIETALQLGGLLDDACAIEVRHVDAVELPTRLGSEVFARVTAREDAALAFDCELFDGEGRRVGRIEGVRARVRPRVVADAGSGTSSIAGVRWRPWTVPAATTQTDSLTRWVVVSDDVAHADLVAAEMRKRGAECRFCERTEDLPELALSMSASDDRAWGLLVLAWGDAPSAANESGAHRRARIERWAEAIRTEAADAPAVWIATRGLLPVVDADIPGTLVGRRVATEIDAFTARLELDRCRFFDGSAALEDREHGLLAAALCARHDERWIAARAGELRVPRLEALDGATPTIATAPRRAVGDDNVAALRLDGVRRNHLGEAEAGVDLVFVPEVVPSSGQLVVEIEAASLCRFDAAIAVGSADAPIGHDFVGRIVAIGADANAGDDTADLATAHAVGDRVLGVHRGSLRRRIAVDSNAIAVVPNDAPPPTRLAVLPELVARHALDLAARVAPGESVLVDAGAGPVAQAILRHARRLCADVHAFARSAEARERLARLEPPFAVETDLAALGAEDAGFAVIVSDASEPRASTLSDRLLAGGRYIDLRAPASSGALERAPVSVGPNRTVVRVDTMGLVEDEPELARGLLSDLARIVPDDAPAPTTFPVAEIDRALRAVVQNRLPGAVTIDFENVERAPARVVGPRGSWSTRFDRIVLDGDAEATLSELAEALEAAGVRQVEIARADARTAAPSERDALVVVSTPADPRRRARREAATGRDATRVFVSLRAPTTGDEATDRSWVSQLWLDRLVRPGSGDAAWHELSVDANARLEELLSVLERALDSPDEPIVVDPAGLDLEVPITPFTADLACADTRDTDLLTLSPAERREHVLALVRTELGTVLGLEEDQAAALAPSRRLDGLGLDSLMSLELFVGLGRTLGLEIARDWFTTVPTLGEIASVLSERLPAPEGDEA